MECVLRHYLIFSSGQEIQSMKTDFMDRIKYQASVRILEPCVLLLNSYGLSKIILIIIIIMTANPACAAAVVYDVKGKRKRFVSKRRKKNPVFKESTIKFHYHII